MSGPAGLLGLLPRPLAGFLLRGHLREMAPWDWPPPEFPAAGAVDVTVVGAGIGGLAAAAALARAGLRVMVAEAHDRPGGYCSCWERTIRIEGRASRFVFDAGVHDVSGVTSGGTAALLRRAGIEGRLDWRRTSLELRPSGQPPLRVPDDGPAALIADLGRRFPADAPGIATLFDIMARIRAELLAQGTPRPPANLDELIAWPRAHPTAFRWRGTSWPALLNRLVGDRAARALLDLLTLYLGDDPAALKAVAVAPLFGYLCEGGWYPQGGSQRLADALVEVVVAHGGTVRLRSPVRRVLVEGGKAAGIELADGTRVPSAAVVAACELWRMLSWPPPPRPSCSAFMTTLAVGLAPDVASVTLSDEVGVMVPSVIDPSLAPPGCAAVTLIRLVPRPEAAGWDPAAADYRARKRAFGDRMIEAAEAVIPGLRRAILYRQDASPATFARFARTTGGAIYGPGPTPLPARGPIPGLALAGSGALPGAGVEACAISGLNAADVLLGTAPA